MTDSTMSMPEQVVENNQNISNISFAEEVKADRLKALTRITGFAAIGVILIVLTFSTVLTIGDRTTQWIIAMSVLVLGCFLSAQILKREQFTVASWLYALSFAGSMSFLLYQAGDVSGEIIPFVFPVIIFVTGLLLSPVSTFLLTILSAAAVIVIPDLGIEGFNLTTHQFFSVVLMLMSAGLGAQVTGELYQITQWALDNYKRERSTNDELFDKRQELQLSLRRAEVLGEKIQQTNEQLEIANAEAEEAKHFRGQFLANMSHELRTPLNAIIGFSETMLQFPIMYDDKALPEPYERDMNQIYNSGRQLLHVINDILDLARVDAGKLEVHIQAVEIGAIVNAVMATTKGLLGKKPVKLDKVAPDPMPTAWVDETRLRQVLLNLYSNAAKYTDEGSITLRIDVQEDAGEIHFALQDTGLGIDPEYHENLFEEFQQAKPGGRDPRSGSGLGLAISRQLLDLMNGRIWMESTVGEGSTFYFTVPLYTGQNEIIMEADATNAS